MGHVPGLFFKKINLLIPLEYDDVLFFPPNGKFTAVFKDGKLGIYLSYWSYGKKAKQTIPCIYDDFQRISYNYQWYLALKKEGKWGWVDFISGEEKSGFVYENVKDLPESDWR